MTSEFFRPTFPERKFQKYLIDSIFSSGGFDTQPRISSSGLEIPCFIDVPHVIEKDARFLDSVVFEFKKIITRKVITCGAFCGVIRGGVPLAEKLAEEIGVPWIARLGRSDKEEKRAMISGYLQPATARVVIVDDVETTGSNAISTSRRLKEEMLNVKDTLYVMSYGLELARQNLVLNGLKSYHLFTINELIGVGLQERALSFRDAIRINNWQLEQNTRFKSSIVAKPTSS